MKKKALIHELTVMQNASLVHRNKACQYVLNDKSNIPLLIELTFEIKVKLSIRAAWILELVCKESLNHIIPYLDTFIQNMDKVKFDSAKRPCAKIGELIALDYENDGIIKTKLTPKHKEQLISCCFDWMISNEKLAVDAYAMMILYIFGKEIDWIHQELSSILENNMANKSAGYRARGLKLLKLMKT